MANLRKVKDMAPSNSESDVEDGGSSRSGSASQSSNRSPMLGRSESPTSRHSRSRSPSLKHSKSGSVSSRRSNSRSHSRSPSGSERETQSPAESNASRTSDRKDKSDNEATKKKKKRTVLSDDSDSDVDKTRKNDDSGSDVGKKTKKVIESDGSGSDDQKKRRKSDDSGSEEEKRQKGGDSSGSDVEKKRKKAKDSDAESGDGDLVIDAEALFGDASDISDEEVGTKKNEEKGEIKSDTEREDKGSVAGSDGNRDGNASPRGSGYKQETGGYQKGEKIEFVEEPAPTTLINVDFPKNSIDLGSEMHFVKLPNFLSIETRPYDSATYEDEIDEEETLDDEGRARLKLKVENTIRWREVVGPTETKRESNARLVKWSDGSRKLFLGSETFDVYIQPLRGDHNHLFIRQGTGLLGQAVFKTRMTFRPHSTESSTHKKMTMSLADRSSKPTGIKILSSVDRNPEVGRDLLIKKEGEKLRAKQRQESKQKRVREKGGSRNISASYLEPDSTVGYGDSDEEAISINAIKKQHKNKPAGERPNIYSSDEEGSDIETRRARKLDKAKALKDSDSESGNEVEPDQSGI